MWWRFLVVDVAEVDLVVGMMAVFRMVVGAAVVAAVTATVMVAAVVAVLTAMTVT